MPAGCLVARQYAKRERERNPKIFFPRCRNDGNYAAVQCLGDTGCWCSDSSGNPIKNTSTRRSRPKCSAYRRSNRRRSPQRQLNSDGDSREAGNGHRPCSKTDRQAFNSHLIELLRSEHVRSGQTLPAGGLSDAALLDWKFAQMDGNANQLLDRQEVRELKKLVKRVSSYCCSCRRHSVTTIQLVTLYFVCTQYTHTHTHRRLSPDVVDVPLANIVMSTETIACPVWNGAAA